MKRKLLSFFACLVVLLNLLIVQPAQAQPFIQISLPGLSNLGFSKAELTPEQKAIIEQLEDEIVPQLETILTSEQRDQFISAIGEGKSFRKAFKSITLTPTQKSQLASVMKSIPKADFFATLTPEQKKGFFMKKKDMFMPTAEEITEKINAGMKKKEMFAPTAEELSEKIGAGLDKKKMYMPSVEEIGEKIKAKMNAIMPED
ncbi:hypothetical protein HJG54_20120 [Leptolyngbya sp. NK1-12]|uniref:DUF2059 domain-containing protein n=1 Tax=Leptolyngbya sp. NK1-12 TaxID=2547451 RepID=A0AA96WGQ0_9CYAN|nr:hypothetical protein [Leptolyngbya sp. NK1-12]WNZ24928.1 hypothetical protein HJG54_20120 [Leptolyngbya sp. NK1-12]